MLIKCKECGKEISDTAEKCPNCGCINNHSNSLKKYKKIGSILCIIGSIEKREKGV